MIMQAAGSFAPLETMLDLLYQVHSWDLSVPLFSSHSFGSLHPALMIVHACLVQHY